MTNEELFYATKEAVVSISEPARNYFYSGDVTHDSKPDKSVVTIVDQEIEIKLKQHVATHFPHDAFIGEESERVTGTSGYSWYIDPIDGTDNMVRKVPFFAVSVARLGDKLEDSFGIVYNPITNQMFSTLAETSGGVFENERVCKLTSDSLGGRYMVMVGRGRKEPWMVPAAFEIQRKLGTKYGRCTTYNCSALELAYLASNKFDAYLTFGLSTYDYAAGLLLAKAAGATISIFENGAWSPWTATLKSLCEKNNLTLFISHPDVHQMFLDDIGDPKLHANGR